MASKQDSVIFVAGFQEEWVLSRNAMSVGRGSDVMTSVADAGRAPDVAWI